MSASRPTPRDEINRDAEDWRSISMTLLGPETRLLSVSRWLPDSRVYVSDGRVAKIRRLSTDSVETNSLHREAEALRRAGVEVTAGEQGDWQFVITPLRSGSPFSSHLFDQQTTAFTLGQRFRVLRALVPELRRLHRLGISHGDLRSDNVMLDGDAVTLVDFDRALVTSPRAAAARDWIGLNRGESPAGASFLKLSVISLTPRVQRLGLRLRALGGRGERSKSDANDQIVDELERAWSLARRSRANAAGQALAYYAWTFSGHHFTGERAWMERWAAIRSDVDFSGKSVLELGCNMGLLSTFATMSGAVSAHGVDHDPDIIESAKVLAEALGASSTFEEVDLMGPADWEAELGGRDIVTALSVVHWLPDKDRVLAFLGRHDEVLYEGHDALEIEESRLRAIGFDDIAVLASTERDRVLLHCKKR